MKDLLKGIELERRCANQPESLIRLVDIMPRYVEDDVYSADYAIAEAARVSYGKGTKKISDDTNLIRYLLRHKHTTPFEMVELKWHMKMPIATARQWIRHRTANVNEYSMRYSVAPDVKYLPLVDNLRKQSKSNKQGSDGKTSAEDAKAWLKKLESANNLCYDLYQEGVAQGISREQARYALNVNFYTEWYHKNDLWNTMNFLRLRLDSHAQQEIRELAQLMYDVMIEVLPISMRAFDDYISMENTVTLSRAEVFRIKSKGGNFLSAPFGEREETEFKAKCAKLGLGDI